MNRINNKSRLIESAFFWYHFKYVIREIFMKIGAQLQNQRKIHGMSQDDLAKELNISRQSVSKWENGTTLPSFSNIVSISKIFGVSLDDLIKDDPELMDRLEVKNKKISRTWWIVIISTIISCIIMIGLRLAHISDDSIDDLFDVPETIIFFILIFNINWRKFNLILNRRVIIIGIIWLTMYIVPRLNEMVAGFIHGFTTGK